MAHLKRAVDNQRFLGVSLYDQGISWEEDVGGRRRAMGGRIESRVPTVALTLPNNLPKREKGLRRGGPKCLWITEAPVGIEPTNGGFAALCLTTWLRHRGERS